MGRAASPFAAAVAATANRQMLPRRSAFRLDLRVLCDLLLNPRSDVGDRTDSHPSIQVLQEETERTEFHAVEESSSTATD